MATKNVKKVKVETNDIAGFKRSRYDKQDSAYGTVAKASTADGDILVFGDIPAREIIYAKFQTASVSLEVFNSTDLSNALPWEVAAGGEDISYFVQYLRGADGTGDDNIIKLDISFSQ